MSAKRRAFSAGIIPLRFEGASPSLLVLHAYRLWDFPKGEVEAGEDPIACARRELTEETTLIAGALLHDSVFWETQPYSRGKVARYYLARCEGGEVSLPVNPELGRPEHHEFRWVPLEALDSLLPERLHAIVPWLRGQLVAR